MTTTATIAFSCVMERLLREGIRCLKPVYEVVNTMDAAQVTESMAILLRCACRSSCRYSCGGVVVRVGKYLLKKGARMETADGRSLIVEFLEQIQDDGCAYMLLNILAARVEMMRRCFDFDWKVHLGPLSSSSSSSSLDMLTLLVRLNTCVYTDFVALIPKEDLETVKITHLRNTLNLLVDPRQMFNRSHLYASLDTVLRHMDVSACTLVDCFWGMMEKSAAPSDSFASLQAVSLLLCRMLRAFPTQTAAYSKCFASFVLHLLDSTYGRTLITGTWGSKMSSLRCDRPEAFDDLSLSIQRHLRSWTSSSGRTLSFFVMPLRWIDESPLPTLYKWGWVPMGWELLTALPPDTLTMLVRPAMYTSLLPYDNSSPPANPIAQLYDHRPPALPTTSSSPLAQYFVDVAAHWTDGIMKRYPSPSVADYVDLVRRFVRGVDGFGPLFVRMLDARTTTRDSCGLGWFVETMAADRRFVPDRDVLTLMKLMPDPAPLLKMMPRVRVRDVEWVCSTLRGARCNGDYDYECPLHPLDRNVVERVMLHIVSPLSFQPVSLMPWSMDACVDHLTAWVFWLDMNLFRVLIQVHRACDRSRVYVRAAVQAFVYRVIFRNWVEDRRSAAGPEWSASLSRIPRRPRRSILAYVGCVVE
jgi:hypothetical protein